MRALRHRVHVQPLGGVGFAGTLTIHLAALLTFVVAGRTGSRPLAPIAYRVSLVAAPAPAGTPAATAAEPVATPEPRPPSAAPSRPAAATPAPTAAPTPGEMAPARAAPAPADERPAPGAAAGGTGPAGSTTAGTDPATIRTEGVEFPFPGYLRNLVSQVYQRWRPPPSQAALVAEVFFYLHRDGSVTGLAFLRRSGSFGFDLEVQGAIESAARARAFGALPDGYAADVLPVSFFFNPRGR